MSPMPDYPITLRGESFVLPQDLYIPPDALEVFLEAFSGPLDLLLYLIRKQNLNIVDIALADITQQYMAYIELMRELQLNLAADYLVMAATLAELKSRSLLPKVPTAEGEEEDPRVVLIRRLQAYEAAKLAAVQLDNLPRLERDHWLVNVSSDTTAFTKPLAAVQLTDLIQAMQQLLQRLDRQQVHHITQQRMPIRERMRTLLIQLSRERFCSFDSMLEVAEGKDGLVMSFVAVLELLKQSVIAAVQAELYAPIYLKVV